MQVVHEQHVDVGARAQLAARVRAERDERDVAGRVEVAERVDERGVDRVGERGAERAAAQRRVGDQRGARVAQPRGDQFRTRS